MSPEKVEGLKYNVELEVSQLTLRIDRIDSKIKFVEETNMVVYEYDRGGNWKAV